MAAAEEAVLPPAAPAPVRSVGDARVALVLEVLAGTPIAEAAARWSVDAPLAERWVRAFVESGAARVTNQPVPEEALQRDRFLAAVAHELRSPLTVARGWAALLEDGPDGLPAGSVSRLQEALDRLADRVEHVELLVAAALGRIRLRMEPTRVGDLVDTLVDGPGEVGGAGPDVALTTDGGIYSRVLEALWETARMDPAPRERSVTIVREGSWWVLRVHRDGDPIEHRRLRALFEPFDHNEDDTGVTFGLYLARALTVALGGSLGIEQDERGAVLWLRTPAAPASAHPDPGPVTVAAPATREDTP